MATGLAKYNGVYRNERLNFVAFPMGGIGAGMICLEGTGAFSHVSLRHKPNVLADERMFAALCITGSRRVARVLEGPVPMWKIFGRSGGEGVWSGTGNGLPGAHYGLPRFRNATFRARFPFGRVTLADPKVPLKIEITGWSPFTPGEADASSLPVAGVEYRFRNPTTKSVTAVFSFHAMNFMAVAPAKDQPRGDAVRRAPSGFVLEQQAYPGKPSAQGAFCAETDGMGASVDCAMFRGGWWDALTLTWKHIAAGDCIENAPHTAGDPSPGGSLYAPFTVGAGKTLTVRLRFSWHVPASELRLGDDKAAAACQADCNCAGTDPTATYRPWYATEFKSIDALAESWRVRYDELRQASETFTDCFYDTDLAPEVVEAVAANLSILKSPTVLRQDDGRLWGWEGCHDRAGCCHGSCTHVWNYAQAIPHLFPALERTLRETEYGVSQDARGHQNFRAFLPIRPADHGFHAAADGQLGGIMKVFREWRISGDTAWLRTLWPRLRQSLDYCIETWDPGHKGVLEEPHHNTYDIEFWGPDSMCTSFYLGALRAAVLMGRECGADVRVYERLFAKGRRFVEKTLWNGEYFFQQVKWTGLRAGDPTQVQSLNVSYSPEAKDLLRQEGPKYQYGTGCLADGVLGAWLALVCGVGEILDPVKIEGHLRAIYRHNLRHDLSEHANPQRPGYALGREGGLLLCTWPRGGKPTLPMVYGDEVWTGFEYQVASHLMLMGRVTEALDIVRTCRDRYDGSVRNPFNEYECGHWYARAMSSYGLLQGLTGARYDAVEKTLYLTPALRGDWRGFLATATGFGTVGVRNGKPFFEVRRGRVDIARVVCRGKSRPWPLESRTA